MGEEQEEEGPGMFRSAQIQGGVLSPQRGQDPGTPWLAHPLDVSWDSAWGAALLDYECGCRRAASSWERQKGKLGSILLLLQTLAQPLRRVAGVHNRGMGPAASCCPSSFSRVTQTFLL